MNKLERALKIRESLIERASRDFWTFLRLCAPDFYKEDRWHLKLMAKTLQAFHENRIVRIGEEWRIVEKIEENDVVCKRLMINMPPRHGKSRTLVLWESWCLGRDPKDSFITASFNDTLAADFSRYVRDTISAQRLADPLQIIFSDIFPGVVIKSGDSSVEKWSLAGSFFSYLGCGISGTVTGKGAGTVVIDDPVKNAETTYSETSMAGIFSWIKNTLWSRSEGDDGKYVLCMTRWPGGDPCERFLEEDNSWLWAKLIMPAEQEDGTTLCPELYSKEKIDELKETLDDIFFQANYNQIITNPAGALYKTFRTYLTLPADETGALKYDSKIMYCDTSDKGDNYTCALAAIECDGDLYITDILFNQESMEDNEIPLAEMIIENGTKEICIESNNGGEGFSRNVDRIVTSIYNYREATFEPFRQTENKLSRIHSNASSVQRLVLFPEGWERRWPEYALAMKRYLRVGKNRFDDAPDATTGLYEYSIRRGVILY